MPVMLLTGAEIFLMSETAKKGGLPPGSVARPRPTRSLGRPTRPLGQRSSDLKYVYFVSAMNTPSQSGAGGASSSRRMRSA